MKKEQSILSTMDRIIMDKSANGQDDLYDRRSHHLTVGDKVIMNNRYPVSNDHKGVIWTVETTPRHVNGQRCVYLENLEDPYPINGLRVVG